MQQSKGNSTKSASSPSRSTKSPSTSEAENASVVDVQGTEVKAERIEDKGINIEGATEEGLKSVINFLKEKIPGLKVKVMNVDLTEAAMDDTDSAEKLMQDAEETGSSEKSEDEATDNLEDVESDAVAIEGSSDTSEEGKNLDTKVFIGGVVHNDEDTPSKDEYVRIPADIKDMEVDSFILHLPRRSLDNDAGESKISKVKVAAVAAQGVSELMPSEVAKAFWSSNKASSKVNLVNFICQIQQVEA